jgi:peptidoglycan/LPS O-acetylase OafA/YrhL
MTDMLGMKLLIFFCIGSLTYYYRQYILIDWKFALLLFALSFVWAPIFYIFMLYGSLTFGASKVAKKIHLPGDYSYGVYIYGFVVQQTVAFYNPKIDAMHSCLIVIPITVFLGVLSWHFIELPAMNYAKRLSIKWESRNKIKAFVSA